MYDPFYKSAWQSTEHAPNCVDVGLFHTGCETADTHAALAEAVQ